MAVLSRAVEGSGVAGHSPTLARSPKRAQPFLPPVGSHERAELYKRFAKRTFFGQTAMKQSQWHMPGDADASKRKPGTILLDTSRPYSPMYPCDSRLGPLPSIAVGSGAGAKLQRVRSEPWRPGAFQRTRDYQSAVYVAKSCNPESFGYQFHGVSDSNLAMRIANLDSALQRARAEVSSFQGKDLLVAKSLEMRAFAVSEVAKLEREYNNIAGELDRRKKQHSERTLRRSRKERSSVDIM